MTQTTPPKSLADLRLPPGPHAPWRFREFPIIAWWGPPGTAGVSDFQNYRDAGFTLYAANPDSGYDGAVEKATRVGLKLLAYRTPQGFGLPAKATDFTSHNKALVGWLVRDEPSGDAAITESITAVNALMRADPTGRALFNLLPPDAQNQPLTGPVIDAAVRNGLGVLSYDSYVIHADGSDAADRHYRYLEQFRQASLRYGVPFWAFALTIRHFGYRRPSESDLRWMQYTNLAYGAKGLWYFTYWGPIDWPNWDTAAIVNPKNGAKTDLYEHVKAVNQAVRAMGNTLLRLRSRGVVHTNPAQPNTPGQAVFVRDREWIAELTASDGLVGFFEDERDRTPYALVVNKRHGRDQSAASQAETILLRFAPTVKRVRIVNFLGGKTGPLHLSPGGTAVLENVPGGSGVLLHAER